MSGTLLCGHFVTRLKMSLQTITAHSFGTTGILAVVEDMSLLLGDLGTTLMEVRETLKYITIHIYLQRF